MGPKIYIANNKKGKAVYAGEMIGAKSLIEICPIIQIPQEDVKVIHQTVLHDYYFLWGEEGDRAAIALGNGSIYNHSFDPNAKYEMDFENQTIDIYSIKDILPGDEITINYNGDSNSRDELWFKVL